MLRPGLVIRLNHILVVNSKAVITHPGTANNFIKKHPKDLKTLTKHFLHLDNDSFLCQGLINLHIHAPQNTFAGTGTDRPVIGPNIWLQT
jgi:guanine deaminase